jgi:hypothetical protein
LGAALLKRWQGESMNPWQWLAELASKRRIWPGYSDKAYRVKQHREDGAHGLTPGWMAEWVAGWS